MQGVLITVVLILVLFLASILYHRYEKNNIYRIVTISSVINILSLENGVITSKQYPQKDLYKYGQNSVKLLKGSNSRNFYLMMKNPYKPEMIISKLNISKGEVKTEEIINYKYPYELFIEYFVSFYNNSYIDGLGNMFKVIPENDNKNSANQELKLEEVNDYYPYTDKTGGVVINNWRAAFQVGVGPPWDYSDTYWSGLEKNYIVVSNNHGKIIKSVQSGYIPKVVGARMPEYNTPLPVIASSDKRKVFMLIRYPAKEEPVVKTDPVPVWLCCYNFSSNKVEKVARLNMTIKIRSFNNTVPMAYKKINGRELIALSITGWVSEKEFGKGDKRTLLIDVNKKQIIKSWPRRCKTIRWSGDGKYLGMLTETPSYSFHFKKYDPGVLYIYNLNDDSEKRINKVKNYYDFDWID